MTCYIKLIKKQLFISFIRNRVDIWYMEYKKTGASPDQDSIIYWRKAERGWYIVIMPESIRIDDNHGYCHIHIGKKKNYHPIKDDTFEAIYLVLVEHIARNKGINRPELRKELHFSKINGEYK